MAVSQQKPVRVVVAMDFSDDILTQLRAVSPRLQIERHHPTTPENAWAEAEIVYATVRFPDPTQAPRLRWIQMHSAGIDQLVKHPLYKAEDVDITTASGVHAVQMSEYSLMMMMAFAYQLPLALDYQKKIEWPEKAHKIFVPHELRGQTLGIVGYGAIGRELARQANALGMTVLASKRDVKNPADNEGYVESGTGDPTGSIPARLYPPEALASMVAECDFVVVTLPMTEANRHVINEAVLQAMKKSAVLINIGRGGVIDEPALISVLASKKIAGAALDVFEEEPLPATSPLWNLDNVILTPHIAGNSARYHEKAAALFAENLQRYLEKSPLLNKVERKRGY